MPLVRRTTSTGVVYYASPLLEHYHIRHAFSTRIGGVSPAPFDSMNLGNPNGCAVQDDTDRIAQNYRRLMQAIGCEDRPRFYLHQMHGADVSVVDHLDFSNSTKGDALVSKLPGVVLSVRVADCCPVLVAGEDGRAVAAIHAGWRGAVGGAINAAVAKLLEVADINPSGLIAAVGPCIGFDAFEVGPEVLSAFESVFGPDADTVSNSERACSDTGLRPVLDVPEHKQIVTSNATGTGQRLVSRMAATAELGKCPIRRAANAKGHADLATACKLQLIASGVSPDRIDVTDRCTHRDRDEFFSHRRDNGVTGRMAALISTR